MKSIEFLKRLFLASAIVPLMAYASTAFSSYGVAGGFVTVGVVCPPAVSETATTSSGGAPWLPPTPPATVTCPNGTRSQAFADAGSFAISGTALDESTSGAPEALALLGPLITPTQGNARVSLTVNTPRPYWDISRGGVPHYFTVHWYGSDAGTALRLQIEDVLAVEPERQLLLDVTYVGPIDLIEYYSFTTQGDWGVEAEGWVVATSTKTPEPGTFLLAAVVLLVVGYQIKPRH